MFSAEAEPRAPQMLNMGSITEPHPQAHPPLLSAFLFYEAPAVLGLSM